LAKSVKMLNSLSADLDILRPSMLETGLDALSFNINRKNNNLQFFEFGKTYHTEAVGKYEEAEHLALFITGKNHEDGWNEKAREYDFYRAKGVAYSLLNLCGFKKINFTNEAGGLVIEINKQKSGTIIAVDKECLKVFDIKAPVYFVDINFIALLRLFEQSKVLYKEIPKFPAVQRDLAMVVDKSVAYQSIETAVKKAQLPYLQNMRLFDIFENEKLGDNKKSVAINFIFQHVEKTLTDSEIDSMVNKLISGLEKELSAEIRK
jgi:phenylalanyl-tRNA synthetase beta chain